MQVSGLLERMNRSDDRTAFAGKVREHLGDQRIRTFIARKYVDEYDILNALVGGEAFSQAIERKTHKAYDERRLEVDARPAFDSDLHDALIRPDVSAIMLSLAVISLVILDAIMDWHPLNLAIILVCTICIGGAGFIFHYTIRNKFRLGDAILIAGLTILATVVIVVPHIILHDRWEPITFSVVAVIAAGTGYISGRENTFTEALFLYRLLFNSALRPMSNFWLSGFRDAWLDDCVESIIIPQATLAINDILGEDKDRLLVEQNAEGLRKLLDPNYTVTTRSELRLASVLSQMDGGSIALAGPRGAGKSTLLREFSSPKQSSYSSGLSVFLEAPAEYIPRDFIAELLQQLCKAFLAKENCSTPKTIYRETPSLSLRRIIRRTLGLIWISCRAITGLALLTWLTWSFWRTTYSHGHQAAVIDISRWTHYLETNASKLWHKYKTWSRLAVILFAAIILPGPKLWRKYFRHRREPVLAKAARRHLERLQVEKTITSGSGITLPIVRSSSLSISKGSSARYSPWTLPELVNNTRDFLKQLADYYESEDLAVVIGIDEIDRIGSLEHAERFIGEIKAVFGIERCFFLVSVAEDVGSVFARRALAGRSILENAFDNIIVIEPLRLSEAREFLLKRVPGFTDSFAYLVHALSGGLPRELIRVARRLVEINDNLLNSDPAPRLEDLAFALVEEVLAEAIRATRSQMSRLILSADWAIALEVLQSAHSLLSGTTPSARHEKYSLICELSRPQPSQSALQGSNAPGDSMADEDTARILISDLSAFAYFGLTVVDSFDDIRFNLQEAQRRTQSAADGSYEALALARNELAVSSASSRIMLKRFRQTLKA